MKFLVDESISGYVAEQLRADGHDALHARQAGLLGADDRIIFERAATEQRVIVSADTDFGHIAYDLKSPGPSLIIFRHEATDYPPKQIEMLRKIVRDFGRDLDGGAIFVFDGLRLRIRSLPVD